MQDLSLMLITIVAVFAVREIIRAYRQQRLGIAIAGSVFILMYIGYLLQRFL